MDGRPIAAPIPQPKVCNAVSALRLAGAGLAIFPCGNDKRPLGGIRWRDESSNDSAKVAARWQRWPDALVGLDCGKSGLVVVDADRHPGAPDGVSALQKVIGGPMMALRCPITAAVINNTPQGRGIEDYIDSLKPSAAAQIEARRKAAQKQFQVGR
jgi:hypothetical protein